MLPGFQLGSIWWSNMKFRSSYKGWSEHLTRHINTEPWSLINNKLVKKLICKKYCIDIPFILREVTNSCWDWSVIYINIKEDKNHIIKNCLGTSKHVNRADVLILPNVAIVKKSIKMLPSFQMPVCLIK